MASLKLTGKLNLQDVERIDPSQGIKVAVTRHCRVIRSVVVKAAGQDKQIKFDVGFDTDSDKPVGVNVVVGPDVPDEQLQSVETHRIRVPAHEFKNGQARVELSITDRLYRWWVTRCRTYTVRGRLVCRQLRWDPIEQQFVPCESPVRGARVTAYDVDRMWWWCRTDEVGSDFTDLNGNFEITFRWCCWWWGPWFFKNWRLDPSIVRRIEELAKVATPVIPLPPPSPELDLKVFEAMASEMEAARTDVAANIPAFTSTQHVMSLGRQLAGRFPAAPDLHELRIWPWWPHWDCKPDLIFKATQDCGEGEVVVYQEGCSDVRWDVPTELSGITLVANDQACCAPCCSQPPDDDCLVFQGVGCGGYPLPHIEQNMASHLVGYGSPGTHDRPFGRTIRLLGVFGDGSTVDYYKLQSRRYNPVTSSWTTWLDIPEDQLAKFNRFHWLGWPPPLNLKQEVIVETISGEKVLKTTRRFREEHPAIVTTVDPSHDDWLALWVTARIQKDVLTGNDVETPLISDGLYELRVVGYEYDSAGNALINPRIMPLCPGEHSPLDPALHATMRLRIDNRNATYELGTVHIDTLEPASDFPNVCAVVKNEGQTDEECVSVCGILSVKAGDTITVHFQASDQDGHLERYTLNAHWAESEVFSLLSAGTLEPDGGSPLIGATYANTFAGAQGAYRVTLPAANPEHARPFWYGGNFKVTVEVGAPVPGTTHHAFQTCCAYLLRLKVWKRTTDGCSASQHFHYNFSEFSFTIVRSDLPCGEGLLGTLALPS